MLIWIFCAVSGMFNGYVVARTRGLLKRTGMFVCLTATAVISAGLLAQFLHQPAHSQGSAGTHGDASMAGIAYLLFTVVICVFTTGAFIFARQARK